MRCVAGVNLSIHLFSILNPDVLLSLSPFRNYHLSLTTHISISIHFKIKKNLQLLQVPEELLHERERGDLPRNSRLEKAGRWGSVQW